MALGMDLEEDLRNHDSNQTARRISEQEQPALQQANLRTAA